MKEILHFLFGFFLFLFLTTPLRAAHIIGGEITYECQGFTNGDPTTNSRTYDFTMRIYRDCFGGGADFDSAPGGAFIATVTIYRADQEEPFLNLELGAPTVNFIDPQAGNQCLEVPANVCVQEGVYEFFNIDLPIIDTSYFIVYQRCCRNNTINNIFNPGDSGATYSIELTEAAQQGCNNSPTFNQFPPIVICLGTEFTFDHSATDSDGDQLVYEFCSPFLGGGLNFGDPEALDGLAPNPDSRPPYDEVAFIPPTYSPLDPMGTGSDFSININTGTINGLPQLGGQFVVGVCVSEFRNGELLSVVRRDFQFNVTTCEALVTADIGEDLLLPDETFIINSCGSNDVNIINQSFFNEFIFEYRWEVFVDGVAEISNETNLNFSFPGNGQYEGRMILNPGSSCSDTAFFLVNIFPELEADFEYAYDTCVAGPVQFNDLSFTAGEISAWSWDFGDGDGSSNQSPTHTYEEPGEFPVNLRLIDANGCEDEVAQSIRYFPVPNLIVISPDEVTGCVPAPIFFDNLSTPIDTTYDIFWDFGDGGSSTVLSPDYVYNDPGLYSVSLEITSPIGCLTDTTFEELILIEPSPEAAFSFSPENFNTFEREATFTDLSDRAFRWFWNFNNQGTSIEQNPTFTFRDTGFQEILLIVTSEDGCQDSLIQLIDVAPIFTYYMPNAFTPNDDSKNDIFKGVGFFEGYKSFNLQVWNRWGEHIFESDDPLIGWNGRKNNTGRLSQPGVYLYFVDIVGPRGEPLSFEGYITLIR